MKTLETKFRDIPWEEARKCALGARASDYYRETWENKLRGKKVVIALPPVDRSTRNLNLWACDGPFYEIYNGDFKAVCVHLAEIGD